MDDFGMEGTPFPSSQALTQRSISWLADDRKSGRKLLLLIMQTQLTVQIGVCAGSAAECPVPVPEGPWSLLLAHGAGWR